MTSKSLSKHFLLSFLSISLFTTTNIAFAKDPMPRTIGEEISMARAEIIKDLDNLRYDKALLEKNRLPVPTEFYYREKSLQNELIANSSHRSRILRTRGTLTGAPEGFVFGRRSEYKHLPGAESFFSNPTPKPIAVVDDKLPSYLSTEPSVIRKPTRFSQTNAAIEAAKQLRTSTSSFSDLAILDMFPEIKAEAAKKKLKVGSMEYSSFIQNQANLKRAYIGEEFGKLYNSLPYADNPKNVLASFEQKNASWLAKIEDSVVSWQLQHTSNGEYIQNPNSPRLSTTEAWNKVKAGSVTTAEKTKLLSTYFGSKAVAKALTAAGVFGIGASMANASEGSDLNTSSKSDGAKGFEFRNNNIPVMANK